MEVQTQPSPLLEIGGELRFSSRRSPDRFPLRISLLQQRLCGFHRIRPPATTDVRRCRPSLIATYMLLHGEQRIQAAPASSVMPDVRSRVSNSCTQVRKAPHHRTARADVACPAPPQACWPHIPATPLESSDRPSAPCGATGLRTRGIDYSAPPPKVDFDLDPRRAAPAPRRPHCRR